MSKDRGRAYYEKALDNYTTKGSPNWASIAAEVGLKTGSVINLARQWAQAHNAENPDNPVPWPVKIHRVNQPLYDKGKWVYEKLLEDPSLSLRKLGGQDINRALYYYVKVQKERQAKGEIDNFVWPIPGRRKRTKKSAQPKSRLEIGKEIYQRLSDNPLLTIQEIADDLGITRTKANNDLLLYVRRNKDKEGFVWPIPGRRRGRRKRKEVASANAPVEAPSHPVETAAS